MAFEFFRRRQKLVMIIMVILMGSFGLGSWGLNQFMGGRKAGERPIAATSVGELLDGELWQAETDLRMLGMLGIGSVQRMVTTMAPGDMEFLTLSQNNENPAMAYALLLKEAKAAGVNVLDAEVDAFFAQRGAAPGSPEYRQVLSGFRADMGGTEKQLRATLARWLGAMKHYEASAANVPPSEPELRELYRNLNEQIAVQIAHLPAEMFLDQVAEPTEEQIEAQFKEFREVRPGDYVDAASFGFGYRQPDRLAIAYLLVNGAAVDRVIEPDAKNVRDYYRAHRDEFLPETAEGEPAATEPMEFSQVKQQITETLKVDAVNRKLDDVVGQVEQMLTAYAEQKITEPGPYEWVRSRMVTPADEFLSKPLPPLELRSRRLDETMDILAEAAGLTAICYPYGETAEGELDPSVLVTLTGDGMTLGEALADISEQVKWSSPQWAMCEGFAGVLFPLNDEMGLFPIRVSQTGLADSSELLSEQTLARSATPAQQPLLAMAFQIAPLMEDGRGNSLVQIGEDGPRMVVYTDTPGRLVWRVVEAVPEHAPETLTDELREQVIQDLRIKQAFALAAERATELAARAQDEGLAALVEAEKLQSDTTDLFPRKLLGQPGREMFFMAMQRGIPQERAFLAALLAEPVLFRWNSVPTLQVVKDLREGVVTKVFSLVPENVEPVEGDQPYPLEPYAITTVEVPSRRQVALVQRVDYRPAVISEYEDTGRNVLAQQRLALQEWTMRQQWFILERIMTRLNFDPDVEK